MDDIEYGKILNQGAAFAWKRKNLWILGWLMVVSLFGIVALCIQNTDSYFVLIFGIAFFSVKIFSWAGLVKAIAHDSVYRNRSIITILFAAIPMFGKLLMTEFLMMMLVVSSALVLLFPSFILFNNGNYFFGLFSVLTSAALLAVITGGILLVKRFASYYIVLANEKVLPAIMRGYALLLSSVWHSLAVAFLFGAFILGILAVMLFVSILILIPCLLITIVLHGMISQVILNVFIIIVAAVSILFIVGISGFLVFKEAVWYYFFRNIASRKNQATVEEKEFIPGVSAAGAA